MSRPRKTLTRFTAAAVAVGALAVAGALTPASASAASASPADAAAAAAAAAAPTYSVTLGSTSSYAYPTDTPASPYIDKDGTFYFQQSFSQYDAATSQNHYWQFFSGSDFDSATKSAAISNAVNPANPADSNANTVWRCQNSPTGVNSTASSGYPLKNYCDLVGTWVDPDTGDWYGLVHNEFTGQPFGDGLHFDAIDYAVSHDQGKTWAITGHAITSPYSTTRGDTTAFPNQTYDYGDGDQRLFVDYASGYFYVYYGSRIVPKGGAGGSNGGLAHVARAPLSGKMATGTWQKWYNGAWTQPGVGGLESNMVPTATDANGYTPVAKDYNPANAGNADQQIAAGTLPPKSDLFIMNITYDAYLGLYLGTPELAGSGPAPQKIYATADLSTQKWSLIGDTGSYTTSSWYRWFVDSVNKTDSMIVGKSYRAYCSINCSNGSGGESVNTTIDSSAPAASPVDPAKTYTIGNGGGRILAQVSGGSATTSVAAATGSALESWAFASDGDGSYRITNASSGQALGVPVAAADRAWATKPTVTALGTGGATVGQQWFIVADTAQAGTYKIVNRYSGLVIGLSSDSTRLAETTPVRAWTNTTGNAVGGTRTAAEQTLAFTVTGASSGGGSLNGAHTIVTGGKALDDPNSSTSAGTQLITWALHGGSNQQWTFTQQADGAYTLKNNYSGLCADDNGGFTTAGTTVIQWTCTTGSNQHWTATKLANGSYTLTNVHTGLLLTTASTADGSLVTQQANTGSALQQWTLS